MIAGGCFPTTSWYGPAAGLDGRRRSSSSGRCRCAMPPLPLAPQRAAEGAARQQAAGVAQRLADALREAERQAADVEPSSLEVAARASAELLAAVTPAGTAPAGSTAMASTSTRIDAFDGSAM